MFVFKWTRRSPTFSAIRDGRKPHSWGQEMGPGQNLGWSGEGRGQQGSPGATSGLWLESVRG